MRPLLLTLAVAAGCSSEPGTPPADLSAARDLAVAADLPPASDLEPHFDLSGCKQDPDCGGSTPRCDVATGRCVVCLPINDNCQTGPCKLVNGEYLCVCGCKMDADCSGPPDPDSGVRPPGHCCACFCYDVDSDPKNCGGCGIQCGMNQACKNGICG